MKKIFGKISELKNRIKNSERGVAAIEFAIMLPFLLIVFYGAYQVAMYVSVVRKVDSVTNDLGFVLSREGAIASTTGTGSNVVYSGGKTKLETTINNVLPFLLFPYKYDPNNATSISNLGQVRVQFVGLPVFSTGTGGACLNNGVNSNTLRILWSDLYPQSAVANAQVFTPITETALSCTDGICPKTCNNTTTYNSVLSDINYGTRANIIYPGQSFVLVDFGFNFTGVLGDQFPGVGFILPHHLEKVSSYAVRSVWIDGANGSPLDGIVQSNELVNNMQYCTDCNEFTSQFKSTGGTGATMLAPSGGSCTGAGAGVSCLRQVCQPAANITAGSNNTNNSGGCSFN